MNVTYYKEQHHNYMVIHKTEDDAAVGYQQKMLADRRMDYLLPAKIRSVDGQEFNYYDITSKLTLKQMYGSRCLDLNDIRSLFAAIRGACEEVDRYLLDTRRICLDPDLIYYNCSGNRYSFLYNVSTEISESLEGVSHLMDYLLDRVSPDDSVASDLVYRLYDQYEKAGADVWDAVLMTEEYTDTVNGEENDSHIPGSVIMPAAGDTCREEAVCESVYDSVYEGMNSIDETFMERDPIEHSGVRKRLAITAPTILVAAGLIGIIVCVVVYFFVYLNEDELIILAAGAGAAILAVAAGIASLLRHKYPVGKGLHGTGGADTADEDVAVQNYARMPSVHMQEFIAGPIQSGESRRADRNMSGYGEEECEESGQTVFFDEKGAVGIYKLYALDRKNKHHIELTRFPCTIGKLTGYVDHAIDHPSISRLHARIDKSGDDLILSDLNSTNGLYLNGIRLTPNETRSIEVGDEIRFGSLNYCLRTC